MAVTVAQRLPDMVAARQAAKAANNSSRRQRPPSPLPGDSRQDSAMPRTISIKRPRRRTVVAEAPAASLAPQLAMLAPHLPAAIASPAAVARMQRAAALLFPASGVGFEARLAGDPSEVDLYMRVSPRDGSAAILGGWHQSHALAAPLAEDRYWQRLARLSRLLWAADDGLLKPFVNRFGLELDNADLDAGCARPSIVFFDLPDATAGNGAGLVRTMTDIVLPLVLERSLGHSQRHRIAAAVEAAAPIARLRHIGVALRRPDPAIRLVFKLPPDRIAECLALLGFGARARPIAAAASAIGGDLTDISLQVDVAESLGQRVGIEFHASRSQAWAGLLRRLTLCRLCTAERAIALSHWQRAPAELHEMQRTDYGTRLPTDPTRLGEGLPVRLLNHAKLSFMPDGALEAKIYLYAGFVWRRASKPERVG